MHHPVAVEIGFFHGVMRKIFQGPILRCGGKIYWSSNKGLPQLPNVSSTTRWLSSVLTPEVLGLMSISAHQEAQDTEM